MRAVRMLALALCCVLLSFRVTGPARAEPAVAGAAGQDDMLVSVPASVVTDQALDRLAASIREIYLSRVDGRATADGASTSVAQLVRQAAADEATATAMVDRLTPYENIYKNLLDILGEKPAEGADEPAAITRQRREILAGRQDLRTRLLRARLYAREAHELGNILNQKTTAAQQALLFQRFPSPLTATFWQRVVADQPTVRRHVSAIASEFFDLVAFNARGSGAFVLAGCLAGAALLLAMPFLLLRQVRRGAARLSSFPVLRRLTAASGFSVLCGGLSAAAVGLLWFGLTRGNEAPEGELARLAGMLGEQIPLAGFFLGAVASILSPGNSDWRIAPLSDAAAKAFRPYAVWFAVVLLLRGWLRYIDTDGNLDEITVQLADAVFILAVAPLVLCIPVLLVRHPAFPDAQAGAGGEDEEGVVRRSIRFLAVFIAAGSVGAMLLGYIPLGYRVLSWVCAMLVTMLALVLAYLLIRTLSQTELMSAGRIGRAMVSLGIPARLIDQGVTVLNGLFSVLLVFVTIAVAQAGGDFDSSATFGNIEKVILGQSIGGITLSFDVLLKCIAVPIIGHYLIRIVKNWLEKHLFPTTSLDLGAQTSIVTIFTYAAWIVVILAVMSSIGVTVSSMTWVVSALSVGIGFGLQSIVQNFVSGIILLAERPVTIGDLVEIGGKTGDIRRISVRSTDIALPDGSTLIVPNSQFITSAVRNATFGHPVGTMSFLIGLPFGTDLSKAIAVMSTALEGVGELLSSPAPSVSVAEIQSETVTLKVSGKTASPRSVDRIANEARLAVWEALREGGILATLEG